MGWAEAIEAADPEIVAAYLLSANLPPPGDLGALGESGKVRYRETAPLPGSARLFHVLSPLDTAIRPLGIWSDAIARAGLVRSAHLYDLIPARSPERELTDPVERRRYRLLLEALRHVEGILTNAESVAQECATFDLRPPGGVEVIGAAPDRRFVPARDREAAAADVARALRCSPRFWFAPSGSHPRKNNERLVEAFARLPAELRADRQLLISGTIDDPTRAHYEMLAASSGAPGSVVVTGYLTDDLTLSCYQGTELVCFASLAEGFGLPVIEAFACGARVVASEHTPGSSFVAPEGRFDPTDTASMTATFAGALHGGNDLATPMRAIDTWEAVAERSIAAFDRLLRAPSPVALRRTARRRVRRVAFVSPFPPSPTGVAAYSAALAARIVATGKVDLDLYWDGEVPPAELPGLPRPRHVRALPGVEALTGRYDDVVFTLGNSHHHLGALDVLLTRGGSVLAHDVRLSNLYRHRHGDPGRAPHGLERSIRAMYGEDLPEGIGHHGELSALEVEQYGLLCAREAIVASETYFVTSRSARALAVLDAGPVPPERIIELPFAVGCTDATGSFVPEKRTVPDGLAPEFSAFWGALPTPGADVIAHFGIVDPVKRPAVLVAAAATLARTRPGILLAFVGPVSDALAGEIAHAARAAGLSGRCAITGPLPPERYAQWRHAATLAVQLRATSNGEASAAIGECLAEGVPTLASALGWAAELPPGTVELVDPSVDADGLARVIGELLDDGARRRALIAAGRRHAEAHTFDRAARDLIAALDASSGTSLPRRLAVS